MTVCCPEQGDQPPKKDHRQNALLYLPSILKVACALNGCFRPVAPHVDKNVDNLGGWNPANAISQRISRLYQKRSTSVGNLVADS